MPYLARDTDPDALAAYIEAKHPTLAPLLPSDTESADLFSRVARDKDLDVYFDMDKAIDASAAKRALARLEEDIQLAIADENEAAKLQHKKDRHAAAQRKHAEKTNKRAKQDVEPPEPPKMSLNEASAAKLLHEENNKASRREKLLENGLLLKAGVGPKGAAGPHIEFFWNDPAVACKLVGVELRSASRAYGVVVFLNREALENFERIKRGGTPSQKQWQRLKAANWSLPIDGRPALDPYSDFWNVLVGYAYRQSGANDFKTVQNSTKEQLESLQEKEEGQVKAKFKAKIDQQTKRIAKAEEKCSEAKAQYDHVTRAAADKQVYETLNGQVDTLRAARDGFITDRDIQLAAIASKYEHMIEVRVTIDSQIEAKKAKAEAVLVAMHTRKEAAGGATATDGAAALAAVGATGEESRKAKLGKPYETHEEADGDKPITTSAGCEPTDKQIDDAILAAPSKWARLAATDITTSGVFGFTKLVVQRAKDLWAAKPLASLPTIEEQAATADAAKARGEELAAAFDEF